MTVVLDYDNGDPREPGEEPPAVPSGFGGQFTVIPDTGTTRLHCHKCAARNDPAYFEVGYHPSLDVLTERARAHNQERHGSRD